MELLGTQQLSDARLQELSKREDVTVLKHVYDTPESILPPDIQLKLFRAIIYAFDEICVNQPSYDDETLREMVLSIIPNARLFQRLYSKTFASVTVRAITEEEEVRLDKIRKALMYMLIERAMGKGDDDAKAARAMNTCMRISMRDKTTADMIETGSSIALDGTSGDAVDPEVLKQVKPLDRMELGPSTVRQTKQ
jgi:hypothetical protein